MRWIDINKIYKLIIICFIYINIIISSTGCSLNNEPIKIGITGTMSGINSDLAVSGRRGVELAVEEFNNSGGLKGRKVELVVKDDRNNSSTALAVDKEFINENIPVVIGHYTSGMFVNSIDYLKDKNILFLSPTISADSLNSQDDNFIRFIAATDKQAIALAETAIRNNHKKFAVIYDSDNKGFFNAVYNNFRNKLMENNGDIVLTKSFKSSEEFDSLELANYIKNSDAQALFIIADGANNAKITQQIRKIGCDIQVYSPIWSNTPALIEKGGSAVEGMIILGAIDINDSNEKFKRFKDKYFDRYGENPTFSSVYSYETANALFQAIKMGQDISPDTIKKNIIDIKEFEGLQETFQIDEYGDNNRKYSVFRIENGILRKVE